MTKDDNNLLDAAFITRWKAQDFSTWNESDIREEFIAPLLAVLGYAKGTVNDVIREKSVSLNQAYTRIGRDRIKIDYIPTVRLKNFWIIEAKPGSPKAMDSGDLLQAHLYAAHPEIQANFVVMINGWEIRVYDTLQCEDWETPLILCTQDNCKIEFPKLREIFGAQALLTSIKTRALTQIEKALEVEFDERVIGSLQTEFHRIITKSRPIVQKNARELARKSYLERQNAEALERKQATFKALLSMMNNPLDLTPPLSLEVTDRIINANPSDQVQMIDELAKQYRGRPHSAFRVHCASIFARLFALGVNPTGAFYAVSVKDALEELVVSNMNYWNNNDLSNALCHLDNASLRIAMKLCKRFFMGSLKELVQSKRHTLSAEDLIKEPPSVAADMMGSVYLLSQFFWGKYSGASSSELVWEGIWNLEVLEVMIEQLPDQAYPKGDGDLMWFQSYGKTFDCLRVGTWDVVRGAAAKFQPSSLSQEASALISLSREDVLKSIPNSNRPPVTWKPSDSEFANLLSPFGLTPKIDDANGK